MVDLPKLEEEKTKDRRSTAQYMPGAGFEAG